MEAAWLYASLSSLLILAFVYSKQPKFNLPPFPALKLPIIGHLYILNPPLHRTFANISKKYGPVFSLQLGTRFVVVVSSPSTVEECFTKNDIVLANRPRLMLGKYTGYNWTNIADSPYGDHWRNLRRICTLEIFSTNRLNMFQSIRVDEVTKLLQKLFQSSSNDYGTIVELKSKFFELSFNIITRMIAGKRYFGQDEDNQEAKQFRELVNEVFTYGGASNPADFLPAPFRWYYMHIEKKLAQLGQKLDDFLQDLIDELRYRKSQSTMVDHLLSLQKIQPEYYTDEIIKGLIMVMINAGTDSSAMTIEWAMSLLLNHPDVLGKARAEIDNIVGKERLVDEGDLSKLKHLRSIIFETLRLFPVVPMLAPHESSDDCKIGGFDVPRGTMVFVNAWAIHRDPLIWEDPESFKPERFDGVEVESWKLLPFGMGRRACPGAGVAQRVIGLSLGTLIQCFEWQRISDKKVDLTEGKGLAMPKAEPLMAKCKARDIAYKIVPKIS